MNTSKEISSGEVKDSRRPDAGSSGLLLMAVICIATAVTLGDRRATLRSFISVYSIINI